ncbi:unnamed protein product [Clonostachys rosea]|uniref:Uncharacterized protein n=1 Tax=Bionectria ochroleuca TaxID=29856 RepID=A0ABY6V4P7_BIOOC|nr:unnamed protein product [Clonostachys rosea]
MVDSVKSKNGWRKGDVAGKVDDNQNHETPCWKDPHYTQALRGCGRGKSPVVPETVVIVAEFSERARVANEL